MNVDDLKKIEVSRGNYKEPEATNLQKKVIYELAEKISKQIRCSISGPFDLMRVVKEMEGEIHFLDVSELSDWSGSIFVHGDKTFDILLPSFTSRIRDTFTIAHELGHYFLHANFGEQRLIALRKDSNQAEWEANWFGASFLMPKYLINDYKITTAEQMSSRFGVSLEAARIRLEYANA